MTVSHLHAGRRKVGAPTISVVLCTYTTERWPTLLRNIASLSAQRADIEEVVLVVDGDADLTTAARETFPDWIRIVRNDGPRGCSGARNCGVRRAGADVVAFLDDDAVPAFGWAREIRRTMQAPTVAAVAGWVEPNWLGECPQWLPPEFYWTVGCSYVGLPPNGAILRNPIGANMAVRRAVFDEVGGFPHSLGRVGNNGSGGEEAELSVLIKRLDPTWSVVHAARAVAHHDVPAGRLGRRYFRHRCAAEGAGKAALTGRVGAADALSSETAYTRHVLPRAVRRGLREAIGGDPAGLARAVAVVEGFLVVASAYAAARVRLRGTAPRRGR